MSKIIENYNNIKVELDMKKEYLETLLDKKALLNSKYNKLTGNLSNVEAGRVDNGGSSENMVNYMVELTRVNDKTGLSLDDEIKQTQKELLDLETHLNKMTDNLIKLHGIEYELYSQIVVKGNKITKAVEKTAEAYDVEPRTVWRVYDKKIKNILKCQ